MEHFINFVWMSATAIFAICCLANMFFINYKAFKGIIPPETITKECLRCSLELLAFMAIVTMVNPASIISLFETALTAFC